MGLGAERSDVIPANDALVPEETVRKAKRLFEYTKYGLVVLDCLYRKSQIKGFRSLNETSDLRLFIDQLQGIKLVALSALQRRCFFNQRNNISRLNDLHTLISRQMGFLLVRPILLRSRGYYHPSPSVCQLSFRYGNETFVFRGDDFENFTDKMVRLDLDLIPQDVTLRIQQGYFKTAAFPLESSRLTTKSHRSSCSKTDHEKFLNELELKFAIDYQGNESEVIIKLEVRWLYLRRPMFLGDMNIIGKSNCEDHELLSEARHVFCTAES